MPTALLLIDVQKGLDDPRYGTRNNPDAEQHMARLLEAWRKQQLPVIHVRHRSTRPESPLYPDNNPEGCAFKPETAPRADEMVFTKNVNNAFVGTDLETYLRKQRIASLVMVGLTTDHCVSTSARMASDLGFEVELVSDGTAAHEREGIDGNWLSADEIHKIHLASLHGEFCTVVSTSDVLSRFAPT